MDVTAKVLHCSTPDKDSNQRFWSTAVLCKNPKLTISGYSRSTDKTYFSVPELNIGLDAGTSRNKLTHPNMFLTHLHDDHTSSLPYHTSNKKGLTVYIPKPVVAFADGLVKSWFEANESKPWDPSWTDYKFIGVTHGESFYFGKANAYRATVFDCIHSVPCVGYCFDQVRNKLKAEYKDIASPELKRLRADGAVLTEDTYCPLFVYVGDTHIDVFTKNPQLLTYPTIVVECTFLAGEDMLKRANRDGHIHWDQLKPIVLANPQVKFILIHWSLRYTSEQVYQFFHNEVFEKNINLDNIELFIDRSPESTY